MLRCGPQSGAFSGSFEDGLALRVVHTLTHEDGGDSGGGAFDRDHGPVCFVMFGVQINSLERFTWAKLAGWPACRACLELSTPPLVENSFAGDPQRRCTMRVRALLQITGDDGAAGDAIEAAVFEKRTERPEDLGLSIADGKALMAAVQQRVVNAQVA
jgi:hypothetical protein